LEGRHDGCPSEFSVTIRGKLKGGRSRAIVPSALEEGFFINREEERGLTSQLGLVKKGGKAVVKGGKNFHSEMRKGFNVEDGLGGGLRAGRTG